MNQPEPLTLDLRGLKCPTPILRLHQGMQDLPAGAELQAIADDRAFELDVQAWCRRTGHALLHLDSSGPTLRARIRRKAD